MYIPSLFVFIKQYTPPSLMLNSPIMIWEFQSPCNRSGCFAITLSVIVLENVSMLISNYSSFLFFYEEQYPEQNM
jgi:hypothetical protein